VPFRTSTLVDDRMLYAGVTGPAQRVGGPHSQCAPVADVRSTAMVPRPLPAGRRPAHQGRGAGEARRDARRGGQVYPADEAGRSTSAHSTNRSLVEPAFDQPAPRLREKSTCATLHPQ